MNEVKCYFRSKKLAGKKLVGKKFVGKLKDLLVYSFRIPHQANQLDEDH